MNLPYLLKPPSYIQEEIIDDRTIKTPQSMQIRFSQPNSSTKIPLINQSKSLSAIDPHQKQIHMTMSSSQESSFEGFTDSPFGKLQRLIFDGPYQKPEPSHSLNIQTLAQPQVAEIKPSPGKKVFVNFYDTIVEENSSNAVDIPLKDEEKSSDKDINATTMISSRRSSSELSFNGKIKGLSESKENLNTVQTTVRRTSTMLDNSVMNALSYAESLGNISLNQTVNCLTESFIYRNEKSPDLFFDDSDDEKEKVDEKPPTTQLENIHTIVEETEKESTTPQPATAPLKENEFSKPPEKADDAHQIETSKENNSLDNSANCSYNCPTESSFNEDQTTMDCSSSMPTANDAYSLFRNNCKRERELLRRIRKCLSGIPPPPSLTIPQLDMFGTIISRKEEILNFLEISKDIVEATNSNAASSNNNISSVSGCSLFKPTHSLEDTKSMGWRDILGVRQHGLL